MSVSAAGGYFQPGYNARPAAAPYAPAPAAQPGAWRPDAYQPAAAPMQAQGGGLSWPRLGAWAAGAFASWKLILPHLGEPGGLITLGVVAGGAYVGEKAYEAVSGQAQGGDVLKYGAWAGGAFGAFKLFRPMMGPSPSGWLIGGLLVGGAWAGGKLYNMLTGR